ncbi:MAG: flagellar hook-basal body protein [Nevskia sp.]|nr:flagellar hook-basal body protein [Nevskia sp.]
MADAISIAKASLLGDLERLNVLSQNTSNAATSGYRRQVAVSLPFDGRLLEPVNAYDGTVHVATTTDTQAGMLAKTSRSLDLALDGDGYFRIGTKQGDRYTRRGDFRLDSVGRLVTSSGDPVLSSSGEIRLTTSDVSIAENGDIHAGTELVGRLDLTQFADPSKLIYQGDGLLLAPTQSQIDRSNTRIRQGYLEKSNVNPLHEMVAMMETSRHFAMTRTVLTAYDDMLDSAINTLGQL